MKNWVTACKQCNRKKWLYAPRENGSPKLLYFRKRRVAKATVMAKGKKFMARYPKLSFKKPSLTKKTGMGSADEGEKAIY